MLEAYLDESEVTRRGERLLVMAGYVADSSDWVYFSAEWGEVLKDFRLPYFHTKELKSRNAKLYQHLDFVARRKMLQRLVGTIQRRAKFGVSTYIRPSDWIAATTPQIRCRFGSAYGLCMEICLASMARVMISPAAEPGIVSVYLEDGHANAKDALERIQNYKDETSPIVRPQGFEESPAIGNSDALRTSTMRIGDFSVVSKKEAIPVQAADLLAYIISAAACERDVEILEGLLDQLISAVPIAHVGHGRADVNGLVEAILKHDGEKASARKENWVFKRLLRSFGFKIQEFPWGLSIDARHLTEEEVQRFVEPSQNGDSPDSGTAP